jgi:hypothetical protein
VKPILGCPGTSLTLVRAERGPADLASALAESAEQGVAKVDVEGSRLPMSAVWDFVVAHHVIDPSIGDLVPRSVHVSSRSAYC